MADDWNKKTADQAIFDYYSEYSASIRRSLLSKNLVKLTSIYDVLSIRESMLALNVPSTNIIATSAPTTLNNLLSKNIPSTQQTLEQTSELYRNTELALNTLKNSNNTLITQSQNYRNIALAQNAEQNAQDLLKASATFLANAESLNVENNSDLLKDSSVFLKNNEANNSHSTSNLLKDSFTFLANNESLNINSSADLLKDSSVFLKNNEVNNSQNTSDLLKDSSIFLANNESLNTNSSANLLKDSSIFLSNNEANNLPSKNDLSKDSSVFLSNNEANNSPSKNNLSKDSSTFLTNNESLNKNSSADLLKDSAAFLSNNESNNLPNKSNLLNDSSVFLTNNESLNINSSADLLKDSSVFLSNNEANNTVSKNDLLKDSNIFLSNNESLNTNSSADLLKDSATFLKNNESLNTNSTADLLKNSTGFLASNEANNVIDNTDLLKDSSVFLLNNESLNINSTADLLKDSSGFLVSNEANNLPDTADLLKDSSAFLLNNESLNTNSTADLLKDSSSFLASNEALNIIDKADLLKDSGGFLASNEALNIIDKADLLKDSGGFLASNEALNIIDKADLLKDSSSFLASNEALNIPGTNDLLTNSTTYLTNSLAQNIPPPANQNAIQSPLFVQSESFRIAQITTNLYNLIDNLFPIGGNGNLVNEDTVDYFGNPVGYDIQNGFSELAWYNEGVSTPLRQLYGTSVIGQGVYSDSQIYNYRIGGGFYGVNTAVAKGGNFATLGGNAPGVQYTRTGYYGTITDAIRNYNLSRNIFNDQGIQPGSLSSWLSIIKANNNDGFWDMLNATDSFADPNPEGVIPYDNATPGGLSTNNSKGYLGVSPEAALNPGNTPENPGDLFTAPTLMSTTVAGNPLDNNDFRQGKRGVRYIIKQIAADKNKLSNFSLNFDQQNATRFTISSNGGAGGTSIQRQRYSIKNPYAGATANSLIFALTNYSSNQTFYLPAYISSYNESFDADMPSINFVGRPEAIYVYNNSKHGGTLDFYVLTDYSDNVMIGTDWSKDIDPNNPSSNDIIFNKNKNVGHFTDTDVQRNGGNQLSVQQLDAQRAQSVANSAQLISNVLLNGIVGSAGNQTNANNSNTQTNNTTQQASSNQQVPIPADGQTQYTVNSPGSFNSTMLMTSNQRSYSDGYIDDNAGSTIDILSQMIQGLKFQPAFFSGDKVDFVRKMEFLGKLTKPAAASNGSSMSFTKPPICHIKLGDWWNSDIVVHSVNFNYDDAPWTLDPNSRVQPMWAKVSMNFTFVGPYGNVGQTTGPPILSTDIGRMFQHGTTLQQQTLNVSSILSKVGSH